MNLLYQLFPKSNKLHAIFNRNTIRVSCSCIQNMSSIPKSHSRKVINKDVKELKPCNCRLKPACPLHCQCQVTDIFKSTVLSPEKQNKVYLGTAEGDQNCMRTNENIKFKRNSSIVHIQKGTTLFKYI